MDWDAIMNKENLDKLMRESDFLSFFTQWKDKKFTSLQVCKKYKKGDAVPAKVSTLLGAKEATERINVIPGYPPEDCPPAGEGTWREKILLFAPTMAPDGGGAYLVNEHFIAYEDFIPLM